MLRHDKREINWVQAAVFGLNFYTDFYFSSIQFIYIQEDILCIIEDRYTRVRNAAVNSTDVKYQDYPIKISRSGHRYINPSHS